jgi:hypothetical protein
MSRLENLAGADKDAPPVASPHMVAFAQIPYKCRECGMNLWPSENETLIHLSFAMLSKNTPCRWSGHRFLRPEITLQEVNPEEVKP